MPRDHDVFKILKDLELKAVGLDPSSNKMQEGYFVAFRTIGLPIHPADFANPFSPLGSNLEKNIPKTEPADPKDAPKTASATMNENRIFTANIAKSMQSYLNTFLLTDDKLRMNNDYSVMPGSSKVSDSWWAIITGANGIPTQSELNPAMKKAYEEALAKLVDKDGNVTPHYQAYMQFDDAHASKVKAWNRAYANAFTDPMKLQMWPNEGKLYHDDADEAMDRWVALGFKHEIEQAIDTLAAQGTDPSIALISRAKKRFQNSLLEFMNVGQIPYTILLPNSWYDADDDEGWNEYTSADTHNESHYSASSTAYGGSVGIDVGLYSVEGGFEHSDQRSSRNAQTKNLSIAFKYAVVDIKRPWLDTSLLNLKNWFLMGDYKKNCISTGRMAQELPNPAGEVTFLPSIVTSFILIKDLRISWDNWKMDFEQQSSSNSGGGSIGLGPFAVSGHYEHHDQRRDFACDTSGESLQVPGIQLIGYVSTINPSSPGVNSADFLVKAGAAPTAGAASGTPAAAGAGGGR